MVVTAITFVTFMGSGPGRNRNGGGESDFGTIYGHKITAQEYLAARNDYNLFYWFRNNSWPENVSDKDAREQIYLRLMLLQKARDLGIHVSDESAAATAAALLRQLDRNGRHVTLDAFNQAILKSRNLTVEDFERFARNDMTIEQLIQTLGSSGELVTPQDAAEFYTRQHQEVSAQAVFFSATNYFSQVTVNSNILAQFYTNELAYYRVPDRVQVNYVAFEISNYLASAEQKLGTTNLTQIVEANFNKYGMDAAPGATNVVEAKAIIRKNVLQQEAAVEAMRDANDFATAVINQTPVQSANLIALAKQKNLPVHLTSPFSEQYGPEEFLASEKFITSAFALTQDDPVAGPIQGAEAFYVIALDKKLPSEIPSLDSIHDRVVNDYKTMISIQMAQRSGTNFVHTLTNQMAAGKSFAVAAVAAGFHSEILSPFSPATADLPELRNHAEINQVKQIAFSMPVGQPSPFIETQDGGFVLFVDKKLPVDRTEMNSQLPQYTEQLRRQRASEMFDIWWHQEFGHWVETQAPKALRDELMGNSK